MLLSGAKNLIGKYGAKIAGSAARGVMRHFGKKKLAKTLGTSIKQMGDKYGWSKVSEFGGAMATPSHKEHKTNPSERADNPRTTSMRYDPKEMRGLP